MQHQIERSLAVAETLDELRNGNLVGGEPAGRMREHARPVGDIEADIERRAPGVRVEPVELAPAGVVLKKAGACGPDDAHGVCNDGGRRLRAARTGPFERDLADRVALDHHRVERAVDGGERMRALHESRLDADVDRVVRERGDADEPHDHAEVGGCRNVRGSISVMPRVSTSSIPTREPKATVARIAIFAAASTPLRSSLASASA